MTPTQVVTLGLLAVGWLAIALPLAMRTRSESLSGSITGFNQAMSVLDPELKATTMAAATRTAPTHLGESTHLQMLRRTLGFAVGSTVVLALAAFVWTSVFVPLFVVSLLGTAGYVALLRHRKVEQDRAQAVITSIRDGADLPMHDRQSATMPVAVGQTSHHFDDEYDNGPDHRSMHASDVRVMPGHQRIEAHRGFDVLD